MQAGEVPLSQLPPPPHQAVVAPRQQGPLPPGSLHLLPLQLAVLQQGLSQQSQGQ